MPGARGGAARIAAWAMAGAALGLAGAVSARILGHDALALPLALGLLAVTAAAGLVAGRVEDRRAAARGWVADSRGRAHRPRRGWEVLVPAALGGLGALWLGLALALAVDSLVPVAGAVAVIALGAMAARPVVVRDRFAAALAREAAGDVAGAREQLVALTTSRWAGPGVRAAAALDLGLMALREGAIPRAEGWLKMAARGRATRGVALAAQAVVHVANGAHDDAERALRDALADGGARVEADGARVLYLLRAEGPAAARQVGEPLVDQGGTLVRAAVACARRADGDNPGAEVLADDALRAAVERAGLRFAVPELWGAP